MQISKGKVVTIDYTLTDDAGNVIDSSDGRDALVYLHGADNIIPGLENALEGKKSGDELKVTVPAKDAYGEHDAERIATVPRDMFGEEDEIVVGAQYHAADPDGQPVVVTVVEVTEGSVTVDGNHPLAGQQLNFAVKIKEIRDATDEEQTHGHAHGPGGHHHH